MENEMTSRTGSIRIRPVADLVGLTGSALCAAHCLIVPASLVFGQIGPLARVDDDVFHGILLWVVVPAAILAFGIGCLDHKDRGVLALGAVGLVSLTAALTVLHDVLGESGERVVAIFASGLLIAAHVRNFRLCRRGRCDHEGTHVDDR